MHYRQRSYKNSKKFARTPRQGYIARLKALMPHRFFFIKKKDGKLTTSTGFIDAEMKLERSATATQYPSFPN